ncbi:YneF family protein [Paenibacillus pasadenensis]|uniref:YneF family protein n=2 Tax=Paenibacillus TaxID=44249 RepID=A0A6H2H1T6_9BACL|nr:MULTISPECIES: YneF family protein [Paenibacillus]PLT47778.1 hypothetical protein B8V81_0685 [Paenibacillus pasadenensis]QGG57965.1 YneF family protein [Paenibacillus sp. B01]QJC53651.1 YneF family protein [Paenibacillus albicereus]
MEWYNIVIPIVTLIVGLVGGFFIGVFYLRKQMEKMQSDPEMLQKMAKQMGYNLNNKQMQKAQQMMKGQQGGQQKFIPNQRGGKRR